MFKKSYINLKKKPFKTTLSGKHSLSIEIHILDGREYLANKLTRGKIKHVRKQTNKRQAKNMQKKTNNNSTSINQWFDP